MKNEKRIINNLDIKEVSDKKLLSKIIKIKPFFSDKGSSSSKITLIEENDIVSNQEETANVMNNYFIIVTRTVNLKK